MKSWFKSKTIWLAILQGIAGILAAIFATQPDLQNIGYLAIMKSLIDLGLRFLTTEAIN